jgi:hypothetical protein
MKSYRTKPLKDSINYLRKIAADEIFAVRNQIDGLVGAAEGRLRSFVTLEHHSSLSLSKPNELYQKVAL